LEIHGYPVKPFLSTPELLRLSEVAAWLLPYRNLLDDLKVSKVLDVSQPANAVMEMLRCSRLSWEGWAH